MCERGKPPVTIEVKIVKPETDFPSEMRINDYIFLEEVFGKIPLLGEIFLRSERGDIIT